MALSLRLTVKDRASAKGNAPRVEKEALLQAAPGDVTTNPACPVGKNRKILVVDDNPVVLKAFQLKLKASGFAVVTSENGAAVARTAEEEAPDLIILDINLITGATMEWSGFMIIQWLRRFPELARIPVILMTGTDIKEYAERAHAAGAVALFQKPVDYHQLLSAILQALGDSVAPLPDA